MIFLTQEPDEDKPHERYRYGHAHMPCNPNPFPEADEILRRMKREANDFLEQMQAAKKACERAKDIDGARMFRGFAADAMRQYRAICLVAPWFMVEPLPGDCRKIVALFDWPVELSSELDRVLGVLEIAP